MVGLAFKRSALIDLVICKGPDVFAASERASGACGSDLLGAGMKWNVRVSWMISLSVGVRERLCFNRQAASVL